MRRTDAHVDKEWRSVQSKKKEMRKKKKPEKWRMKKRKKTCWQDENVSSEPKQISDYP